MVAQPEYNLSPASGREGVRRPVRGHGLGLTISEAAAAGLFTPRFRHSIPRAPATLPGGDRSDLLTDEARDTQVKALIGSPSAST